MSKMLPMMVAVRGYAVRVQRSEAASKRTSKTKKWTRKSLKFPSEWSLTFDAETTSDHAQNLRFLTYQLRKLGQIEEQGIAFVADNPIVLTPRDILVIREYARERGYTLCTRDEFVRDIFYRYGYGYEALIVGFNLPFDLSRLAIGITTSHAWDMRNAFSLTLSEDKFHHNVLVKHLNARSAFMRFAFPPRNNDARSARKKGTKTKHRSGFFQDVKTLAAALTGKGHKLDSLAELLETPHRKILTEEHGGPITPEYLDYAMNDTQVTWECYDKLREMYEGHGLVDTPPHRIYSEASLGKAYLRQMGIVPLFKVQPDVSPELIGQIMQTYYGGRAEVRRRRQITRVLYCDFRSMYPTVCTLMGLWRFVIAQGFDWVDWTKETRMLLNRVNLGDLQNPDFWRSPHVIVQIGPKDDVFPIRAPYGGTSRTIGLNHLTANFPVWYTLADCISSKLFTGRAVRIVKAIKFIPREPQTGLKPIRIGGNVDFTIHPATDDFYKNVIVMRGRVQALEKQAKAAGDHQAADRHGSHQMMLKLLANSTSYGIFAEQNVQSFDYRRDVDCYVPDGEPMRVGSKSIEEPGTHFHPLIATLITGGARLMLTLAERVAAENGIGWAFCDTDSLALARPAGMADDEFLKRGIAVTEWFTPLDPYKDGKPLFKMEDQNFRLVEGKVSDIHEPLYALAIAAKRYGLFNLDSDGRPIIRKALAHGLGHLRPPYTEAEAPKSIPAPSQKLSTLEVEWWQYDLWYRIIRAFQEGHPDQVDLSDIPQLDRPAQSRYGANTAPLRNWFFRFNRGKPFHEQVKCFNFMLAYQVSKTAIGEAIASGEVDASLIDGGFPAVVAPYDTEPERAVTRCFDRRTGKPVPPSILKTYREAIGDYHTHAESKFENGDSLNVGITLRRHVQAVAVEYIGKEANRWEEQFYLGEIPSAQIEYGTTDAANKQLLRLIGQAARKFGRAVLAEAANLSRQQLSVVLARNATPRPKTLKALLTAITALEIERREQQKHEAKSLGAVRNAISKESLTAIAQRFGLDPSNLRKMLTGQRKPSRFLLDQLDQKH